MKEFENLTRSETELINGGSIGGILREITKIILQTEMYNTARGIVEDGWNEIVEGWNSVPDYK